MLVLLLLTLVVVAVWLRRRGVTWAAPVRQGLALGWRELKIASGSYELGDVVDRIVRQSLAAAIPSVRRTYMPTRIDVGLSEQDGAAWDALFPAVAEELAELIASAAACAGFRVSGPIAVVLRVDPAAEAGKPVVNAMIAPTTAPADGSARSRCGVIDLDKTQVMTGGR